MSGFLYFLPNARPADIPTSLKRWGLSYLLDEGAEPAIYSRECIGPEGIQGMVAGSSANWQPEQVKIPTAADATFITWKRFPKPFAETQAFIGFYRNQMPTPADLARQSQIKGEYLTLADGYRWLVPIARRVTGGSTLPLAYSLDEETGDWVADQVLPKYRKIWDHANAYLKEMLDAIEASVADPEAVANGIRWSIPDGNALVVDALQVNYRVSAMELAVLGVLTTGIHQQIADILIDDKGWQELKKKEVAGTGAG